MKPIHYHFAFFLLLLFAVGCGGNPAVTGKVTLADGTLVTAGEVIFETSAMMAQGAIQPDGTYAMSAGLNKGIPKGTYRVSLSVPPTIIDAPGGGPPTVIPPVFPFHRKYTSPETSGLVCEVKGRTTFNITVEPPER